MLSPTVRRMARSLLLVCVLATGFGPTQDPATRPDEGSETASTEVRLRKLHLVRPDLIPYPIAYEVVC